MLKPIACLCCMGLFIATAAWADSDAARVFEQARQGIKAETAAQAKYEEWRTEKETLSAEIRDLKATDAWLEFQIRKYRTYVSEQQKVLAELARRKQETTRLRRELEPFLETIVRRLEEAVAADLPFLGEERTRRIAFLKRSLADYHLGLGEKLRRVLEALRVEAEYGRTVERTEETLDLNGTQTRVRLLRLGRIALFYQSGDGAVGIWDAESGDWRQLDATYALTLRHACDMAERKRAVELLALPVSRPTPVRTQPAVLPAQGEDQ